MPTHAEIGLLLRLDRRRLWTVLDARSPGRWSLHAVFVRAWAAGGFVHRVLSDGDLPPPGELRQALAGNGPAVLVGSGALPEDLAGLLGELPDVLAVQQRDGRLFCAGRPLDDLEPVEVCDSTTSVHLQGRNTVSRHHVDLPQTFRARGCAVPVRSVVRVEVSNPAEPPLPPRWFRLPGPGRAELRINVRPGRDQDRLEVTINGEPAAPAPAPAEGGPSLDRLGLVFDRTCPDRGHWGDARLLVVNPLAYLGSDRPAMGELNRSIREGLTRGLAEWARSGPLTVHLAWFADVPGEDVAGIQELPPAWALPQRRAETPGERQAEQIGALLEKCSYSPGLDLWDPLQDALDIVAEPLVRRPRPGTGVLIVGNSPPDLPLDATSGLYDLLRFPGHGTTARRRSNLFTRRLGELDNQGVPVVYLFLLHDHCEPDEVPDLHVYQALHEQIRQALGRHVAVVAALADAEGVARGVQEALTLLAHPAASGVRVEELP